MKTQIKIILIFALTFIISLSLGLIFTTIYFSESYKTEIQKGLMNYCKDNECQNFCCVYYQDLSQQLAIQNNCNYNINGRLTYDQN